MATARVVLGLGGDVAAGAEALRVLRTTLYYRLDRIEA
jgi:sugar diacid utilization regulator